MSEDIAQDSAGFETRARIDTSRPHSARFWNYFVGGKDHYKVDREIGEQIKEIFPGLVDVAHSSRLFLGRAVRFLVAEQGVRQFLDIGTGLPTANNTHEVAQRAAPDARIVYVDNDPIVLTHARALLAGTPEGRTAYLDADFRDHERILSAPETSALIDFKQPVALLTVALLHFIPDADDPGAILEHYKAAMPPGSVMIFSHATTDLVDDSEESRAVVRAYTGAGVGLTPRSRDRITEFFAGWDLVEPGVVPVTEWRPDGNPDDAALKASQAGAFGGVAIKPA